MSAATSVLFATFLLVLAPISLAAECPEPLDDELIVVNTGMPTCWWSNCDRVVDQSIYFICFPPSGREGLCAHDMRSRETRVLAQGFVKSYDPVAVIEALEVVEGDLNHDGDAFDHFLRVSPSMEPPFKLVELLDNDQRASSIVSTRHLVDRGVMAFFVRELSIDLNNDGDANGDLVLHLHALGTTETVNTRLVGQLLQFLDGRLYLLTREDQIDEDLNGDGTINHRQVLRIVTIRPGPIPPRLHLPDDLTTLLRSSTLDVWNTGQNSDDSRIQVLNGSVYFGVTENVLTGDLNGDGDLFDTVEHELRLDSWEIRNLGRVLNVIASDPLAPLRLIALEREGGSGFLRSFDLTTGEFEQLGEYEFLNQVNGDRVLLSRANGDLEVVDLATRQSWFAGRASHPGAASLRGGRVSMHVDSSPCYEGTDFTVVEYHDYEQGNWARTELTSDLLVTPRIAGPVLTFPRRESFAKEDLDGDGQWLSAVETYVLTPDVPGTRVREPTPPGTPR